jgi:hypothetical protein
LKERFRDLLVEVFALWQDMRQSGRASEAVRRLEAKSYAATIVAAAVAIVVFAWGLFTFILQTNAQNETAAVAAFQKHTELSLENPEIAGDYPPRLREVRYEELYEEEKEYLWYGSHAYLTAETVYNLTKGDEAWDATVARLVRDHEAFFYYELYVTKGGVCQEFDRGFIAFVEEQLNESGLCPATQLDL